ncbi:hypothetical protein BAUCODRAFT_149655 [Baudoinia panamericana UAMH 10762]|uniref:Uncharacterized protein n=1 Tax=Baudoinia panamericana (strain UAMH 10762) TaxID=717646 RepID=M2N6X2_BAUPA|nr:uncharacterized protein BAUCODRAFT_149655 [Baudoinia panamericana UAMH 10762]EMC94515.1 hypothetical protein BAUCODRAFT_149655 [Baudoinia panamericana UAMH 10762]
MGAVLSCIESVFGAIGSCIMAVVNAIASVCMAIINDRALWLSSWHSSAASHAAEQGGVERQQRVRYDGGFFDFGMRMTTSVPLQPMKIPRRGISIAACCSYGTQGQETP